MGKPKKPCVCDGSGYFTNPFDQEFKCEGDIHDMPKPKKSPAKRVYKVEFEIVEDGSPIDVGDVGMYTRSALNEFVGYYVYGLTGVEYLDVKNLKIKRVK